jgi:hypothetical protein
MTYAQSVDGSRKPRCIFYGHAARLWMRGALGLEVSKKGIQWISQNFLNWWKMCWITMSREIYLFLWELPGASATDRMTCGVQWGHVASSRLVVQHSVAAVEEFAQATDFGAVATMLPQTQVLDLEASDMSWLKMNWDASLAKDKDWMGVGMVLWDEKGFVIAAYSKTIFGRLDVLKAEAKAALMAIQVCKSLGFSNIPFGRRFHKG